MLDPWVVHGYKSLSCNNFLNPSQFYQQGEAYYFYGLRNGFQQFLETKLKSNCKIPFRKKLIFGKQNTKSRCSFLEKRNLLLFIIRKQRKQLILVRIWFDFGSVDRTSWFDRTIEPHRTSRFDRTRTRTSSVRLITTTQYIYCQLESFC